MDVRWTAEQVDALTSHRDVLLAASAGTGKTTTIVGKILWSLGLDIGRQRESSEPIAPCPSPCRLDQIAAITFTEKAAHDLQDKLRNSLEALPGGAAFRRELDRATVGTIHGFAADLLREHALRLDIDPTFRIVDQREVEIQQTEVVRGVLATALRERDPGAVELTKRYGLIGWKVAPGAIFRIRDVMRDLRWRAREFDNWSLEAEGSRYPRRLDIDGLRERAKFAGAWATDPAEVQRDHASLELSDTLYRLGRSSVHHWLNWLERENARDFDSLILDARRLLTRPATRSALAAVRRRYRLFIIDEFQDTDRAQWDIAQAIIDGTDETEDAAANRPAVVLVGDPKQSIYRFRGADIDVWNAARTRFERDGRVLELSWNFRCEPRLVDYVNRVAETALGETASRLQETAPESTVSYQELRGARPATSAAALEWIAVDETRAGEQRAEEATRVAGRLHELIGKASVVDPETGALRICRASDIAILARRQDNLAVVEAGLRSYGVPFYNATTSGLADQQEILDLVTALRVIQNPFDDLAAFAFLRSPFVGLRDEVLVRVTLSDRLTREHREATAVPLLERAERFLGDESRDVENDPWFPAPEGPDVVEVERRALRVGLEAIRDA
ncbi:MAG: UvrD-helicase domain-containing protein, partial [Gemmatimonadota bacterium]|nr:UvrD-helicase domain-containing protein [Gemmatimonadota bacterium]